MVKTGSHRKMPFLSILRGGDQRDERLTFFPFVLPISHQDCRTFSRVSEHGHTFSISDLDHAAQTRESCLIPEGVPLRA